MDSKMFARVSLVFALPVALGVGGCDAPNDESVAEEVAGLAIVSPEEIAAQEVVELDAEERPVVAVIDGVKPGMVEFLDVSETDVPEIMVVAVGAEGAGMISLIDADTASPLELYLAFTDTQEDAPAPLFQDHDRLAGEGLVPAAPREFKLARETVVGDACVAENDPGDDAYNYWVAWSTGYGATNGFFNHGILSPGLASGSAIQVSNSTRRALDACGTDSHSTLYNVKLQTLSGGVWGTLGNYTAPGMHQGWGVATRSISSSGTLTARLVMTTIDGNNIIRFFWGGSYST